MKPITNTKSDTLLDFISVCNKIELRNSVFADIILPAETPEVSIHGI
jgi:hypothetical protein